MWLITVFFGVLPYLALATFIVGHVWRWKYDQFGWTTRTSELMEKRLLMWASPIFHFGLLFVFFGHLLGLLVPPAATQAIGLSDEAYHLMALGVGTLSGLVLGLGLALLLVRRFVTKKRLRLVTRQADIVMYILVAVVILFGLTATIGLNLFGGGYDYRQTIAVWFRSIFILRPAIDLMSSVPWLYQVHVVAAYTLFAIWPFTRLVHLWSIPLGYFVRPAIVYHAPQGSAGAEVDAPVQVAGTRAAGASARATGAGAAGAARATGARAGAAQAGRGTESKAQAD